MGTHPPSCSSFPGGHRHPAGAERSGLAPTGAAGGPEPPVGWGGLCCKDTRSRVWVCQCPMVQLVPWGRGVSPLSWVVWGRGAVLWGRGLCYGAGGCAMGQGAAGSSGGWLLGGAHTRLAGSLQTLDVGPEIVAGAGAAVGTGRGEGSSTLLARLSWARCRASGCSGGTGVNGGPRGAGAGGCVTWADSSVAALGLGVGAVAVLAGGRVLGLALAQAVAPAAGVQAGPPGPPGAPEAQVCGTRPSPTPQGHHRHGTASPAPPSPASTLTDLGVRAEPLLP